MPDRRRDFQRALDRFLALDFRHVKFLVVGLFEYSDIRRGEIDGGSPHGKSEPRIGQRRRDPVPRLLHRRVRQADDDDEGNHATLPGNAPHPWSAATDWHYNAPPAPWSHSGPAIASKVI